MSWQRKALSVFIGIAHALTSQTHKMLDYIENAVEYCVPHNGNAFVGKGQSNRKEKKRKAAKKLLECV